MSQVKNAVNVKSNNMATTITVGGGSHGIVKTRKKTKRLKSHDDGKHRTTKIIVDTSPWPCDT